PDAMRRLNDIAFSGDGEPTAHSDFSAIVSVAAEVRHSHRLDELKLVLITNASLLDRRHVRLGLAIMDQNNGQIWAKLDAGSEAYFRVIARTVVPYKKILKNILEAARARPIVIQSLFVQIHEQGPSPDEIEAYSQRLLEILAGGGKISMVQIHTIARPPAELWVSALSNAEVESIAETVRKQTNLSVATFYG
ncbi:MAG: radical SAM protein, partial [Thermoguttaceae bacterium]